MPKCPVRKMSYCLQASQVHQALVEQACQYMTNNFIAVNGTCMDGSTITKNAARTEACRPVIAKSSRCQRMCKPLSHHTGQCQYMCSRVSGSSELQKGIYPSGLCLHETNGALNIYIYMFQPLLARRSLVEVFTSTPYCKPSVSALLLAAIWH